MFYFTTFAVAVIVLLAVAALYYLLRGGTKRHTTIPGPVPKNVVQGNLSDIVACGSLHEFLRKAHNDYGPIVSFWIGRELLVSIGSAKLFKEVENVFDRGPILYTTLLSLFLGEESITTVNGAEGRRRHAIYSKCFTPTSLKAFYSIYNELSLDVVDRWRRCPKGEFIPLLNHMFAFAVRSLLYGPYGFSSDDERIPSRVHAAYDVCLGEVDRQFKGDVPEDGGDRMRRFNQHRDIILEILSNAIRSYHDNPSSEGRHSVIAAAVSLHLPESAMKSDLLTIFMGGFHTTSMLMTWAVYQLSLHQDIQDRARDEVMNVVGADQLKITPEHVDQLVYLRQVVNETLRWAIIGPYACRIQDTDIVIGSHTIPASTNVVQALGVALHDPEIFAEPEKFDPERFSPENERKLPPYAFEPFGFAGKRKCFGYRFAVAEASVLLANILRSNLRLTLAPDQVVTPKYTIISCPSSEVWISAEQM